MKLPKDLRAGDSILRYLYNRSKGLVKIETLVLEKVERTSRGRMTLYFNPPASPWIQIHESEFGKILAGSAVRMYTLTMEKDLENFKALARVYLAERVKAAEEVLQQTKDNLTAIDTAKVVTCGTCMHPYEGK